MAEILGFQLRISDRVPSGEAWIYQPEERISVRVDLTGKSGSLLVRPAKLLGRIVNLESSETPLK